MSLDTSGFFIAVEGHFGIQLEIDGSRVRTIGDLADVILSEVVERWSGVACPTRRAFFDIRKSIQELLAIENFRVRPSTRLDELFPHSRRKSAAIRLQYETLPKYVTVGDLARKSIGWFVGRHRIETITRDMVLADLIPIVGDEFGVDNKLLHADIRFVEDLDVA